MGRFEFRGTWEQTSKVWNEALALGYVALTSSALKDDARTSPDAESLREEGLLEDQVTQELVKKIQNDKYHGSSSFRAYINVLYPSIEKYFVKDDKSYTDFRFRVLGLEGDGLVARMMRGVIRKTGLGFDTNVVVDYLGQDNSRNWIQFVWAEEPLIVVLSSFSPRYECFEKVFYNTLKS